jgi:hypothetical protein
MLHDLDTLNLIKVGLDLPVSSLSNGRTFLKEVAYVGTFGHYDQVTGKLIRSYDITKEVLDHWRDSVKEQVRDGISIPIQGTHKDTENVDEASGLVLDASTGLDSKGRYGLFFVCEFSTEDKAADLSKVADVSIYQPASYVPGSGKVYARPIRHLMLTLKPVIHGLDKFVALSITTEEPSSMNVLKSLATSLGVTVAETATEEEISAAISAEFSAVKALAKPIEQSGGSIVPAAVRSMVTKTRGLSLDKLVAEQKITPAMKTKLSESFASKDVVALSADGADVEDPVFDGVVLALSMLPSAAILGKQLPNNGDPTPKSEESEVTPLTLAKAKAEALAKKS